MFVIITGASRGIGRAFAIEYAKRKYNLILTCDKNIVLLYDFSCELKNKYNVEVLIKKGILIEDDIKNINDIYMLINNASKDYYDLFLDLVDEKIFDIINSNVLYNVKTTKLVLPKMKKNKMGLVVNISSIYTKINPPMEAIYTSTKSFINTFTKCLSKEFKDFNIDIISFSLGAVETDMNSFLNVEDKKEFYKADEVVSIMSDIITNKKYNTGDIIEINNLIV